jgi:hypothetical protein
LEAQIVTPQRIDDIDHTLDQLVSECETIMAKAQADGRDLTDIEMAAISEKSDAFDHVRATWRMK